MFSFVSSSLSFVLVLVLQKFDDTVENEDGVISHFDSRCPLTFPSLCGVLVNFPILHDDEEVFGRVFDQFDVCERIAVHQQEIRKRAFFNSAKLARVWIAFSGKGQQFGVGRGRHDQHLSRRVPLDELGQKRPLFTRQVRRKDYVGAPGRFDLVLFGQLVGRVRSGEHLHRLFSLERAWRKSLSQFVGERLHAQPDTLFGHQFGGRLVHQMAMLDALYASGDGALDRLGRVGMHGDIRSPIARGLDGGPQFLQGEGARVERAVRRGYPSASGQLDLTGPQHELLTYADTDFVRTVGDHGGADLLAATQWSSDDARHFPWLAEIAVTARDRDDGTGREDAWTDCGALVYCLLKS